MTDTSFGLEIILNSTVKAPRSRAFLGEINQVGIVVRDLRKTMRNYWSFFGIGTWNIFTYAPPKLTETAVKEKPQPFSMKVALAKRGPVVIELIEPLEGHSVYKEFLSTHGEGIHHLGSYMTSGVGQQIAKMKKAGVRVLQTGKYVAGDFSVRFTYMDTEKKLGTVIEYLSIKGTRPKPNEKFP
jgi:methylmalonyl-CoA/ethylmalonyl-CoA epimerase